MNRLRCAIYTRKSSEEGLEQGFNSLHAQREACEAYVLSQVGEGWSTLPKAYDDGGFTGGNMDRPGLKSLLADIARGQIDVVVVYKVDRLTRSLPDFAKIVEQFDQHKVSFVSVTQAFNTTSSMGRLTLNVLLSFAQFEREVTGERIRDKILASKQKGLWMGGQAPLGYDPPTDPASRILKVNEAQAETVRLIFRRYLELGSVHLLKQWLNAEDIRSKRWVTRKGRVLGDQPFNRGALFHLLRNRTYVGEVPHHDRSYLGLHPGIVEPALFDQVQVSLDARVHRKRERPNVSSKMLLKGLIFDARGSRMTPSVTRRSGGKVHRYYISSERVRGTLESPPDDLVQRISAEELEPVVKDAIARISLKTDADTTGSLARVDVEATAIQLTLRRDALFDRPTDPQVQLVRLSQRLHPGERLLDAKEETVSVWLPYQVKRWRGRTIITHPTGKPAVSRTARDTTLIKALLTAHRWLAGPTDRLGAPEDLVKQSASSTQYERQMFRLAFLAPDIQQMILEGRQPSEMTLTSLLEGDIPVSWKEQRRVLEIPC